MKRDSEIKKVGTLFDIYKSRLKAPQKSVIDATVEVIKELTNITIDPSRCTYTVYTYTFSSNAPSLIRQEIKKKEQEILIHLKGRLGEKSAPKHIN